MKYLLIIDHIATGGAERILIDYYHHLKRKGHEVSIFVLIGKEGESMWTKELEIIYGSQNDINNLVLKTKQQIQLYFKLKTIVEKQKPDIIFSFLEKSNLLTLAIPSKAKKIVTVHNVLSIQYKKIKNKIIRKAVFSLIRRAYNHSNNVIAVSKQVKDDLVESLRIKSHNITVINNYVDSNNIKEKAQETPDNFTFEKEKKYMINIGRFSEQKAQWKLIKAFSISKAKQTEWDLIIMGHGEYKNKLEQLSANLNLQEKVHILPFQPNPYQYMQRTDLFILPSLFEGFPIVLAEASSLRIPFIGSEKAIPEEMFDSPNIWNNCIFKTKNLAPNFSTEILDDEIELAHLIDWFTENEEKRKEILAHTAYWEKSNYKNYQFEKYDLIAFK
jgi:glycosyltransferase involved in cell wall biosynthesis